MMGPWMFFGGWWMILAWVILLAGAALVVRALPGWRRDAEGREDRALSILSERFARGEISEQEYARMRAVLRK